MQPKFTLKKVGFLFRQPLILSLLLCLAAVKVNSQCNWTASTVYPINVLDQATATVGTNLYSFAGVSNGVNTTTSFKFDGATWTGIAPAPQPLEYPAAVSDGTNAYLLGGYSSSTGTVQATIYRYNVATNTYTTLTPATVPVWALAAVYLNGKIYKLCGGTGGGGATGVNNLEIYDIATNTWTAGAPYPLAIGFVSAWANGNYIYAAGGVNFSTGAGQTKAYRYDPASNTWDDAAMADLPTDRWGAAHGSYFGGLLMPGGYVAGAISPTVVSWIPATNAWATMPNLLALRARFSGAVLNGAFYAIGGREANTFTGNTNNQRLFCAPCVPISTLTAPSSVNAVCSGTVAIPSTMTPGNASVDTRGWEYRVNSSGNWLACVDGGLGGTISGATTATLTLSGIPTSLNGYQFRAFVNPPPTCGYALEVSNIITLNVGPLITLVNPTSATICKGTSVALALANPTNVSSTTNYASGPLSIQIPDGIGPPASPPNVCAAGISHSINAPLPIGAIITRVDVRFNITHTYSGDLVIVLKAPNGQILNLDYHKSRTGTGGNNFTNTVISSAGTAAISSGSGSYTGTFKADAEIGAGFFGDANGSGPTAFQPTVTTWAPLYSSPTGNWTIAICDPYEWRGDIGTLTSWDITFTYLAPAAGVWTASPPGPPNTMWLDPGLTIPYPGPPATASVIYVNPTVNTVYSVQYNTVTPACTGTIASIPVNVVTALTNQVSPTDKSVCVGGNTSFTASATGGPFTYQWQESIDNGLNWNNITNGGVYSGATTGTLTLTGVTRSAPSDMNNYQYRCRMAAPPCGGTFITNAAKLTVFALPTVTISATDLALTPGQRSFLSATSTPSPHGTTPNWVWTRNGAPHGTNASKDTANINSLGVYQVSVTDVNGCRNSSNSILIESEVSDRMWIYPNPNTGKFEVRLYYDNVYSDWREVTIYNQLGQKVTTQGYQLSNVEPHYLRMTFDLSGQPNGVYVVKAYNKYGKKHAQGLVIKQ